MPKSTPTDKQPKKPQTSYANYLRYSGIAIQMIVIIVAGTFGGRYLDQKLALHFPVFTLTGILLSLVAAIYNAVKEFIKK